VTCTVLTFASREDPTLVCQETGPEVDGACDLQIRAGIATTGFWGAPCGSLRDTPGEAAAVSTGRCCGKRRAR
jgi:hypothetical protein